MSTDKYEHWKALAIRRPDDVPTSTPLAWLAKKASEHSERVFNNSVPDGFPYEGERGDAGDALAALALWEAIRRGVDSQRGDHIHEALRLGATWTEVAAALDIEPDAAREILQAYADGQRHLWLGYEAKGAKPIGFSSEQYAAALALCERGDEQH